MFPVCVVPDAGDGRRRGDPTLSFGGRRNDAVIPCVCRTGAVPFGPAAVSALFGSVLSGVPFEGVQRSSYRGPVRLFGSEGETGRLGGCGAGAFWNILAKPVYLLPENGLRDVSRSSFYDNV